MSRTNPFQEHSFQKYLGREDIMHSEIVRGIRFSYPDLFWWHTPNEGKRTPFEQYKFKELGGDSGVADFVVLEESNFSKGLLMEVKCGKNKCSVKQVDFLVRGTKRDCIAAVVYDSAADALELIKRHMAGGIGFPSDGILLVKGGKHTWIPIQEAYQTLCVQKRSVSDQAKLKAVFGKQAAAKFGKAIKEKARLFASVEK